VPTLQTEVCATMTLQAKLTLGTVLLATVIVAIYSVVYLGSIMDLRFSDAYAEAGRVRNIAVEYVTDSLNSHPETPVNDLLASDRLTQQLETEVVYHKEIVEVAVVDADNNILADNFPDRRGQPMPPVKSVAQLEPLVHAGWISKVKVLWSHNIDHYEVDGNPLGPPPIIVRVVVQPATIRDIMQPDIQKSAGIALVSVVGAICLTFLFSAFAFRPLGRLRRQLDLLASGEYEADKTAYKSSKDEVSIMASKVSLLGERLRGAQFEMSDLRGNIDRFLKDLEDAVLIFNRENRLVFASGSVSRFLGKERAALSGERIGDIFPPSTNLGFLIAQAAESGMGIRNRRIPLTSLAEGAEPGPSVLLSVDWLEAQTEARTGLLVRLRDPEAQRQIGRQLQTADRLAAISRISGGVAHEVKNPLNAILLHVEVARTRLKQGETDVSPQMEVISREILRLDRVVKTFLDFTRPVELKYRIVPLRDVVREIEELTRPQAEAAKVRMTVEPDSDGVDVRVDRDMFKQALLNVVVNAIQAMKDGGELRLECSNAADTAEIRIIDSGPGVPPELRDKIFRLYFTTKQGGSGIGLAMTFRIVQLHDGTIDFSSEPGKGTTFVIRLPIAV
jgi:signal transduction histidine kinase